MPCHPLALDVIVDSVAPARTPLVVVVLGGDRGPGHLWYECCIGIYMHWGKLLISERESSTRPRLVNPNVPATISRSSAVLHTVSSSRKNMSRSILWLDLGPGSEKRVGASVLYRQRPKSSPISRP